MYGEVVMSIDGNQSQMGSNSTDHALTQSTFSSPLYSSQSVDEDDTSESRDQYRENGTLMSLMRMQSERTRNEQKSPKTGGPVTNQVSSTDAAAEASATKTPITTTGKINPYASYKESVEFGGDGPLDEGDDQGVYENVEAQPITNFDDPDYEVVES